MHNERASSFWEHYFTTYWWVFAALATIGIVSTGILYFEHVAGRHIVDWCSAICAMLGGLVGALLIVLTHSQLGTRNDGTPSAQHLRQVEARLQILESQDAVDKRKTKDVMFFGDFKSGRPKH
jgi:predicted anti-sigma-YlaC factor YlaD